jgi:hypothetical protein
MRSSAAVLALVDDRIAVSAAYVFFSSDAHRATRRGFGRGQVAQTLLSVRTNQLAGLQVLPKSKIAGPKTPATSGTGCSL